MKHSVRIAVAPLSALALLYLLVRYSTLTWSDAVHSAFLFPLWALICVFFLTWANLALGTLKWLVVMRAISPTSKMCLSFRDAMLATTIGAMMGHIMPSQLGIGLSRFAAGRLGIGQGPMLNAGTTAYEQLFDAIVISVAAMIGLLGLVFRAAPMGWMVLLVGWGIVGIAGAMSVPWLLRAASRSLLRRGAVPRLEARFCALSYGIECICELPRLVLIQLILMSMLRYFAVFLRCLIVLAGLGLIAQTEAVVAAFPFFQAIGIVQITPGNLGITEWGWSAVLVSAGGSKGAAALFALSGRMTSVAAQGLLTTLLFSYRLLYVNRADIPETGGTVRKQDAA